MLESVIDLATSMKRLSDKLIIQKLVWNNNKKISKTMEEEYPFWHEKDNSLR